MVLHSKTRRNAGEIVEREESVVGLVQGDTSYRCQALMDAADIANPAITLGFQLFLDGQLVRDETWTCGVTDRAGNPVTPHFEYGTEQFLPSTARSRWVMPADRSIRFGDELLFDKIRGNAVQA